MNILKIQNTVKTKCWRECVGEKPEFLFSLDGNGNSETIFKDSLMTYYNIKKCSNPVILDPLYLSERFKIFCLHKNRHFFSGPLLKTGNV